jgi:hypothetical protein
MRTLPRLSTLLSSYRSKHARRSTGGAFGAILGLMLMLAVAT